MARFQKGMSGNPAGRGAGAVSRQLKALREAADKVLPLLVERALAGDARAQETILAHAVPKPKSVSLAESFDLNPNAPRLEQLRTLLQQTADGAISPSVASELASVISLACKIEEVDALRAEVDILKETLERRVVRGKNDRT